MRRWVHLCSLLLLVVALASPTGLAAQSTSGFARNGFEENENNVPGSYQQLKDPTGSAPTRKVDSFSIISDFCATVAYNDDERFSDCKWQSVRSLLNEDVFKHGVKVQPKQGLYGWYMYLPEDFPLRGTQVRGGLTLTQFHNGQCPHIAFGGRTDEDDGLYFSTNRARGNYECDRTEHIRVASMLEMRGKWTRFELYVEWDKADGRALLFVDGQQALDYRGRTLTIGHEKLNYFAYGIYLCCTAGVDKVVGTTVLFAGVGSAATREGLAVR